MSPDEPTPPDVPSGKVDPAGLKDAHARTGRMFKNAGLPFEAEEFEGDGEDSSSESSESSSSSPD